MFCSIKALRGYRLLAQDGVIGRARETCFDDQRWVIRHVVADTGGWLGGRQLLISPHSISRVDTGQRRLELALTRQQVDDAPSIDSDLPVLRQHEIAACDHFGHPYHWSGHALWGHDALPLAGEPLLGPPRSAIPEQAAFEPATAERETADPLLRSSAQVITCQVLASDGAIGHVDDFLFDDRSWQIRYAVVNTRNWLPDHLVLVSPQWISSIDWDDHQLRVKVSRDAVKTSPTYQRGSLLSLADEQRVHRHHAAWLAAAAKARVRFVATE